jgi:hypothetical protein
MEVLLGGGGTFKRWDLELGLQVIGGVALKGIVGLWLSSSSLTF